jgi:hypothetical protein
MGVWNGCLYMIQGLIKKEWLAKHQRLDRTFGFLWRADQTSPNCGIRKVQNVQFDSLSVCSVTNHKPDPFHDRPICSTFVGAASNQS